MWTHTGRRRPNFAEAPGPGRESVWDYPRPPRIEMDSRLVEVKSGEQLVASSRRSLRVLETASPPTFYLPPLDVNWSLLRPAAGSSVCEWKGTATYWRLASDPSGKAVGWSYPDPSPAFVRIRDYVSFYPAALACFVAGERVRPQPGRFYGGWVTNEIVGPFKGAPGTEHW